MHLRGTVIDNRYGATTRRPMSLRTRVHARECTRYAVKMAGTIGRTD